MLIVTFIDSNSRTYEQWREDQLTGMASWCVRHDVDIEGLGSWAPAKYQAVEVEGDFLLEAVCMFTEEYGEGFLQISHKVKEYGKDNEKTKGESLWEALGFMFGVYSTLRAIEDVMLGKTDDLQLIMVKMQEDDDV